MNYLKTTIRNIVKYKGYSFINILGLAVGMAAFVLIALYVQYEFNYDKFHRNYQRIYRVEQDLKTRRAAETPAALADNLINDFPEIVNAVRIIPIGKRQFSVNSNNKKFYEQYGIYADSSIFQIFTFPLIKGDPKTALTDPFSIVITDELAGKYFPGQEPLGQVIRIKDRFDCKVTGIIKKPPFYSHLKFNYIVSLPSYKNVAGPRFEEDWNNSYLYTYVLLQEKGLHPVVNNKIRKLLALNLKHKDKDTPAELYVRALAKLHLYPNLTEDIGDSPLIMVILLFLVIGISTLLIASINYMNLATAYSANRAKEVGIKKVVGSSRLSLIRQFLSESILLSIAAMIIAILLVYLFLPEFNRIVKRELALDFFNNKLLLMGLLFIAFFVGTVSGSYPAFFLSAFQPVKVLTGNLKTGGKKPILRKILVASQYVVSVALIILTFVIYAQINYLKSIDYGFERENILIHEFDNLKNEGIEKYEVFKNELLKNTNIRTASISKPLGTLYGSHTLVSWDVKGQQRRAWFAVAYIDYDFIDTFDLVVKEGRNFSGEFSTDKTNACIVNETAAELLGWDSCVGKQIYDKKITVVGVVKDFRIIDANSKMEPLMLLLHRERLGRFIHFSVKIAPQDRVKTVDFIKRKFEIYFPEGIFDFQFYDDFFASFFVMSENIGKLIGYFSLLAFFIASLGLFALVLFSVKQRTKEIGIRKVFGASITNIFFLLSKEFLQIVVIANLIAWPLTYYILGKVLQTFPARVSLKPWIFLLSGLISFMVAIVSVSFQSIKAAAAKPISSLRYE